MTTPTQSTESKSGAIGWLVHNRVTPNLVMLLLLIGGMLTYTHGVTKEVFPSFDTDTVTVSVPYPGASPEEIEQGIILVVEEAIRGLNGIKEVRATATEGSGQVVAELIEGVDRQEIFQDIQQEINRVTTFPDDAEEPIVSINVRRRDVLELQVYGDVGESNLRESVEMVRDALLQNENITQVELRGARDREILIEIPQEVLRRYGLTMQEISDRLRSDSTEIPAGSIDTTAGDVLVRIDQRNDWANEFAQIPIVTTASGGIVRLGDVATVRDGFEDTDVYSNYNGHPAIEVKIYRIGDQTPASVANAAYQTMEEIEASLPPNVHWGVTDDDADLFKERRDLLLKNIGMGLAIVLVVLGLFLELRLAFWVMMGIPISFLGTILLLPYWGMSINMISMFAFLISLGIVVDDAIVVGENVYEYRQRGMSAVESAIQGTRDVGKPVYFAVITNIIAFIPLAMIPGFLGKIWGVIPVVVCTAFALSLIESLYILPSHLAHSAGEHRLGFFRWIDRKQQGFSLHVRNFIYKIYGPFLDMCIRQRMLTLSIALAIFLVSIGYVASGRLGLILMPRIEANQAVASATLPVGSPLEQMQEVEQSLLDSAYEVAESSGGDQLVSGYTSSINNNTVEVSVLLTPPEVRPISTAEITRRWRDSTKSMPSLETLKFESDRGGPGGGAAISVDLSHRDITTLDRAAERLGTLLEEFGSVSEVDNGVAAGKQQLDFQLNDYGRSLGLTGALVGRQLRDAYQGSQAIKQQRGRNEVTVRVRLPESERVSEFDLEKFIVQTPNGVEVPLQDIAVLSRGNAFTEIKRTDGRRTSSVTADVTPISQSASIKADLEASVLPKLMEDFPGLSWTWAGRQADMSESMSALGRGLLVALCVIYFLLAMAFSSYTQPFIVMAAIPFGIIGAILGHIIMGYSMSAISMMGIIALSGVVVNDSLVLIESANRVRATERLSAFEAVHIAGVRRFRPILLTTLTTFGGLAPMIFETSRQARFMIPMAISLGFGILVATAITLILVPALYVLVDDTKVFAKWVLNK
ncbi:MAG: efflux RND transporter permease subunit [Phycisphaerales bacterium]|nr:efflux RND transporter permease subunit [Phycisphaerales bacterium]